MNTSIVKKWHRNPEIIFYLEREQIPTPRAYLMDTYGKYHANEQFGKEVAEIRKKQRNLSLKNAGV